MLLCYPLTVPFLPAALARKVYLFPNRGVGSYAKVFGGAQDNGAMTQHHRKAATSVIRAALQSLEKLGLIETADKCVCVSCFFCSSLHIVLR